MAKPRKLILIASLLLVSGASFAAAPAPVNARSGVCEDSACGRRAVLVTVPQVADSAKFTATTSDGGTCQAQVENESATCPGGMIQYRRTYTCQGAGNSGVWSAWQEISRTCT